MSKKHPGLNNFGFSTDEDTKVPNPPQIAYAPLTTERLTKALISEFLWHYQLFQDAIEKLDTITDYQVQTKIHFTHSQMVILKRKLNIDLV
jgi:hypothetical protein